MFKRNDIVRIKRKYLNTEWYHSEPMIYLSSDVGVANIRFLRSDSLDKYGDRVRSIWAKYPSIDIYLIEYVGDLRKLKLDRILK